MRTFLSLLLLLSLTSCSDPSSTTAKAVKKNDKSSIGRPKNVIFILVDTLRADYLGLGGFVGDISPNIDRIAQESVVFERAISPAPWTKAAVASIFTSQIPTAHRVTSEWFHRLVARPESFGNIEFEGKQQPLGEVIGRFVRDALPEESTTLAEILGEKGYRNASFCGGNGWISKKHGITQGFEHEEVLHAHGCPVGKCNYPAEPLGNRGLDWVKENVESKEPFFLYLHFMDVHGPYVCLSHDYVTLFDSPSLGKNTSLKQKQKEMIPKHLLKFFNREAFPNSMRHMNGCYAAGVRVFDRALQRVYERLEREGYLQDSIVVFTSDHGEEFFEHGKWDHGKSLYNELLHVPLWIRMPGGEFGGRRIKEVVSTIDIMPTLLGLLGVKGTGADMHGEDLSDIIRGAPFDGKGFALSSGLEYYPHRIAIQSLQQKLIYDLDTPIDLSALRKHPKINWDFPNDQRALLFDLKNDQDEKADISATQLDLLKLTTRKLTEEIRSILPEASLAAVPKGKQVEFSETEIEELQALGYLQ